MVSTEDLNECSARIDSKKQGLYEEIKCLESEILEKKKEIDRLRKIGYAISGLPDSWKQRRPGRDKAAYFFLDTNSLVSKRVIVRQFLNGEADLPRGYKVVGLDEIARKRCPQCGTLQPLIECYYELPSSYDSKDKYVSDKFILCLNCDLMTKQES